MKEVLKNGMTSRQQRTMDLINAPKVIDYNIDMRMPAYDQMGEKKYKCYCCGSSWDNPLKHFSRSASPLYQANDGYLPICNKCRDKYYEKLVDLYNGNEAHAIEHFCMQFDIIFHVDALSSSRKSSTLSRISSYLSKRNLGQTARIGATYVDGIKYEYVNRANLKKENNSNKKSKPDDLLVQKWGAGFSDEDYYTLESHYKTLKDNNPNCDNNQEIFIKNLCNLHMLSVRALKTGDVDKYTKLVDQYSKTFKTTGLKTIEEKDDSNNASLGVTLATISKYTPEEFYKDKNKYKDFDNIGEYVERFMTRPLRNLQYGSVDRDEEYFVPEDDFDE